MSRKIKKQIFILGILTLSLTFFAQELTHESLVVNVEVPVRVFKGSTFIDNLTIDDFEVYEDGKLQKIEAVYLIKKTKIERKEVEEKKKFSPKVSRHFVLLFEIREYLPKIGEAIDYFFENVIVPGDVLKIVTPLKTYDFKKDSFEKLHKQTIADQLKGKLKKDTKIANAQYWSLYRDLIDPSYIGPKRDILRRLKNLRYFDEKRLLDFAEYLKNMEGQKYVFLFYQREMIPIPEQIENFEELELFDLLIDITFDVKKVKQAFSDSSITSHFLFITKTRNYRLDVVRMQASTMRMFDISAEIFSAFSEMAKATGGLVDSSANAAASFERAVEASENYYLLYYAPSSYQRDGKFKNIKVKVKGKSYKITHRAGYFAN